MSPLLELIHIPGDLSGIFCWNIAQVRDLRVETAWFFGGIYKTSYRCNMWLLCKLSRVLGYEHKQTRFFEQIPMVLAYLGLALVQRNSCQKAKHSSEFQRESMPWTFLLVPSRQNYYPVNPSYGWGRYPWRQSSHHIPRETLLLRLSCIPKELFWLWLLSHPCSQNENHKNGKGYSEYESPSLHM